MYRSERYSILRWISRRFDCRDEESVSTNNENKVEIADGCEWSISSEIVWYSNERKDRETSCRDRSSTEASRWTSSSCWWFHCFPCVWEDRPRGSYMDEDSVHRFPFRRNHADRRRWFLRSELVDLDRSALFAERPEGQRRDSVQSVVGWRQQKWNQTRLIHPSDYCRRDIEKGGIEGCSTTVQE